MLVECQQASPIRGNFAKALEFWPVRSWPVDTGNPHIPDRAEALNGVFKAKIGEGQKLRVRESERSERYSSSRFLRCWNSPRSTRNSTMCRPQPRSLCTTCLYQARR